ncbi:ATP-grasp domain-containing protein [Pseudoduganella lurida]|uniref:ATP-grasp domain-containing protein n=1 Tax=Pseudoduganella lurida TaxID=1036180 RepID=A0A562RL43_9BURK|nr:ATP-grasp domain-containing protein [Pseudoduganella lurida]TWI69140.1 ATP-grasp domain-containing protein [Pseudoduganella lurida]
MPVLKVLAFDDSGAGTSRATPLHPPLFRTSLLSTLCADLQAVPGVQVVTPAPDGGRTLFAQRLLAGIRAADAVWPLLPPAGGLLESAARLVLRRRRMLLGSSPAALHITASRRRTAAALLQAGVPALPVHAPDDPLALDLPLVVKPDDGAGSAAARLFRDGASARGWLAAHGQGKEVLQPFCPGRAASLCLLCRAGTVRILSRNALRVAMHDNQFHCLGCMVNGLAGEEPELDRLAAAVAAALPGLWGYVELDVILGAQGPVVFDIHARLMPSYAGLRASLGCNPAALVLGLLDDVERIPAELGRRAVSVDHGAFGMG